MKRDVFYLVIIGSLLISVLVIANKTAKGGAAAETAIGDQQHMRGRKEDSPTTRTNSPPDTLRESNDLSVFNSYLVRKGFPIIFDAKQNGYELIYTNVEVDSIEVIEVPIKYCPWTGQPLTLSKGENILSTVSEDEKKLVESKMIGVNTLDDVKRVFGAPDVIADQSKFSGAKRQWTYTNLFQDAEIVFTENEDGSLTTRYFGKSSKGPKL